MVEHERPSAAIVGGGISGLTTAFLLKAKGFDITVYEKNAYPGGLIKSIQYGDWLAEWGPNTLMAKSDQLWDLINQLDLTDEVVKPGKEAKKRYVIKNGILHPLPTSLWNFVKTDLISTNAKLRLFKEPFIKKGNPNESIANFFERRLGKEVVDYAINPFIAGIYAGDPQKLSVAHTLSKIHKLEQKYGSLLKGAINFPKRPKSKEKKQTPRGLISFKAGIQELAERLCKVMDSVVQFETPVIRIQNSSGRWQVVTKSDKMTTHRSLIFTAPLHTLPDISFEIDQNTDLEYLSNLRYAPIATVCLGFRNDQISHPLDGFGMLVPEVEPYNILGCLFSSSLFPGRAPENHALLTCFLGGDRNPEQIKLSDEELQNMVLRDLQKLLGCSGEPVFSSIHKWERAIPQYDLDYQSYLDAMQQLEEANPGLYFTGNFRKEVSVPGCIQQAYETADRAASFMES